MLFGHSILVRLFHKLVIFEVLLLYIDIHRPKNAFSFPKWLNPIILSLFPCNLTVITLKLKILLIIIYL